MTGRPGRQTAPGGSPGFPVPEQTAVWRRLHPLSPVVRVGAAGTAALVVAVTSLGSARSGSTRHSSGPDVTLLIWGGLFLLALAGGVVSWLVTRWRVSEGDLQIEKGLIFRQSLRIPLARIQAIDVVAPFTARILGLAEVRVVSAGRGGERARLAYLSAREAPEIRARLLALAHGLAPGTAEPPAYPLFRVTTTTLVGALLSRSWSLVLLTVLVAGAAASIIDSRATTAVLGALLPVLLSGALAIGRGLNEHYGFTIAEAGDGLRLDRGLLQRRHETIPFGRIQAVRMVQPPLWRPFGLWRLDVDVARQHAPRRGDSGGQQVSRTLAPVATAAEVAWLLSRVVPAAAVAPPPGARPPRRAMVRAPLSVHLLAAWHDERYVCARTGRLQSATVVVPLVKVQSVRLTRGPVQRALRLATVHVDTAGRRWHATAACRDQVDAERLVWAVAAGARAARRVALAGAGATSS